MPTIPLLKANVDLAMPQVPALDRERRPQIDVSNVLSAMSALGEASKRRGVDPGPFVEAAGAKGEAVGRGLSQVGNVMSGLAEKMVEAAGKERLYRQDQEIEKTREQYAAKISTAPDPAQAFTDGKKAVTNVAIKNAAPVRTTPVRQAMIHGRGAELVEQSIGQMALLNDQRLFTSANEAMVGSRDAAIRNRNYDQALGIGLDLDELNGGGMEHTVERVDMAKRNDLLTADPREYRRMMGLPLEERPDFMASIPEVEAQLQNDQVETAIAWKRTEVAGSISADIELGVLASSRELAFKLEQGKYDPTGELSREDVAALLRKFQGAAINDPGAFVKMMGRVANFDHATEGERATADLKSEILLNFADDYEEHLLSKLESQVKGTRGVSTLNDLQQMRGTIHEDIAMNLEEGQFGGWVLRGSDVFEDLETGRLMRHALPGERGDQVVKLSEAHAAAYQEAKAAGGEALDQAVFEDLTLKKVAERRAMGVMQGIENDIDARKFPDGQRLREKYTQEMGFELKPKGPASGKDDLQKLTTILGNRVPPPGSVLVADSTETLAQMLDDGVDFPIYTQRFGGEYEPPTIPSGSRPVPPRMNDVNAPKRKDATDQYLEYANLGRSKRRREKEEEWKEKILNDPESLANQEMLEKALMDFEDGDISNQTMDVVALLAGSPVSGTEIYLKRKADAAEIEKRVEELRPMVGGSKEPGQEGVGADPRLTSDYKAKIKEAMAEVVAAQRSIKSLEGHLADNEERRAHAREARKAMDDVGRENYDAFIKAHTSDAPLNKMMSEAQAKLAQKIEHLEEVNRQTSESFAPQIAAQEARYDEALKDSFLTPQQKQIVKERALLAGAADVPRDFWEQWGSSEFWEGKAPFAGGFARLYRMMPAAVTAGKLENGEEVSPEELAVLRETMIELNRPNTNMAEALDWAAGGASLLVEVAATAGIYAAVKKGVVKLAETGMRSLLTKGGLKRLEEIMAKQALKKESVRLFTYQQKGPFVGDVLKTGPDQGRLWATRHGPEGDWWNKPGLMNTLRRGWRTGRWRPFESFKEITGPAAHQFRKVRAIGPFRGWKRLGGQYYTTQAGNLNLNTGKFLAPNPRQIRLRTEDALGSHGMDILALGVGAWSYKVLTDDFSDVNLPPIALPSSKKDD